MHLKALTSSGKIRRPKDHPYLKGCRLEIETIRRLLVMRTWNGSKLCEVPVKRLSTNRNLLRRRSLPYYHRQYKIKRAKRGTTRPKTRLYSFKWTWIWISQLRVQRYSIPTQRPGTWRKRRWQLLGSSQARRRIVFYAKVSGSWHHHNISKIWSNRATRNSVRCAHNPTQTMRWSL